MVSFVADGVENSSQRTESLVDGDRFRPLRSCDLRLAEALASCEIHDLQGALDFIAVDGINSCRKADGILESIIIFMGLE